MLHTKDNSSWSWKQLHGWDTLFLVLSLLEISDCRYHPAKYLFPLTDTTGTAQMVNHIKGTRGFNGLGDVTSFDVEQLSDHKAMYFHGTNSSFVELTVGEQTVVGTEWSFAMFVYATYPRRGTVFDCLFNAESGGAISQFDSRIRLTLNGASAVLTILQRENNITFPFEIDNFLSTDEWVPLAIAHKATDDRVVIKILTKHRKVYQHRTDDTESSVRITMPAKIKLGGAFNISDPFEGSVACFAIFDGELSKGDFDDLLRECMDRAPVYNIIGFDLQTLQKSDACSVSNTVIIPSKCILFDDLFCESMDKHIVIKKALFGFHETEYENCSGEEEMCRSSQHSGCCTKTEGDEIKPLSQKQFRNVATKCSFKSECYNLQADVGYQSDGIPSSFSIIYFVCQPVQKVVSFCGGDKHVEVNSISVVFNGSAEIDFPAKCICQLNVTEETAGYRVSGLDIRLDTASTRKDSKVKITGPSTLNASITQMDYFDLRSESRLQLTFQSKPEFVWILIQGIDEGKIQVSCSRSEDENDGTTRLPDTTAAVSKTESPSTKAKSTSTSSNNNVSDGFLKSNQNEAFPVAAVIIPVVLILLGVVAGLFVWRRWHRRQPESKTPVEHENRVSPNRNQPTRAVQNKAYDDTDQQTAIPMKTANNYFVLDQENAYTYIDHGEAQNTHTVDYKNGGDTADQSKDNNSGGHNYFVLEQQKLMEASPIVEETNKSEPINQEASQNRNYFVLEPQKPHTGSSISQKTTATGTAGWSETKTKNNQNYEFAVEPPVNNQNYKFALEPPDTYSCIDPDDVVIQTLPENEYNVINMTGNATISRDPNYGTLETVEDSGEYSHIGNDSKKKQEMNEYMKGKSTIDHNYGTLGTADKEGGGMENSGDYSHIGKG